MHLFPSFSCKPNQLKTHFDEGVELQRGRSSISAVKSLFEKILESRMNSYGYEGIDYWHVELKHEGECVDAEGEATDGVENEG